MSLEGRFVGTVVNALVDSSGNVAFIILATGDVPRFSIIKKWV